MPITNMKQKRNIHRGPKGEINIYYKVLCITNSN